MRKILKTVVGSARNRAQCWRLMCLLALGLHGILSAVAQESATTNLASLKALDFEQLLEVKVATVYAASKFEQKITEAPSSVSVVSSEDRKSTRLNSSHRCISYAVFCLKKKKKKKKKYE